MRKIYVAGPYSGSDARQTQLNVNRAIEVGCALMRKGWAVYIPHLSHYVWMHPCGDFPYSFWLRHNREWLKVCDALFFMSHSYGSSHELGLATELGLSIYTKLENVPDLTE